MDINTEGIKFIINNTENDNVNELILTRLLDHWVVSYNSSFYQYMELANINVFPEGFDYEIASINTGIEKSAFEFGMGHLIDTFYFRKHIIIDEFENDNDLRLEIAKSKEPDFFERVYSYARLPIGSIAAVQMGIHCLTDGQDTIKPIFSSMLEAIQDVVNIQLGDANIEGEIGMRDTTMRYRTMSTNDKLVLAFNIENYFQKFLKLTMKPDPTEILDFILELKQKKL